VKEGLAVKTGGKGRKIIALSATALAAPDRKGYIPLNLWFLIRSRIESGPRGTRSFLLPERPEAYG